MLITNVKLGGRLSNIYVNSEGIIECINCNRRDGQVINAEGGALTLPFVNSHVHLSQALTLGYNRKNETGKLIDGLALLRDDVLPRVTIDDVKRRLEKIQLIMFMNGTLYVRDHEPILNGNARRLITILHETSLIKVQVVACPSPSLSFSDNENEMERTLEAGADVVGAMPHGEDREGGLKSISKVFDIAQKFNKPVDGHIDEIDDPESDFSFYMVSEAKRRSWGKMTTLSHMVSSQYQGAMFRNLLLRMKETKVSVVINPETNLHLQGRYTEREVPRGLAPLQLLLSQGINVSLGR
ncbi:hypothetical protein IC006_2333 [Sulfuracidifex tepidarius]|uniref:Uncharacterized protein n=1 Tax=Sulfuracidifex tepidarius TaxID=1294262 RepID=A0A510DXU1_9CREN|nr:amidohydrolase family protein [Sulfuracidifex tepidarius]BBG24999.1 hypothetical protein IC006_2333 [Sulfuracidifex tepidarius]